MSDKMCPMFDHVCYREDCEAWSEMGCRIIYGLMFSGVGSYKEPVIYGVTCKNEVINASI